MPVCWESLNSPEQQRSQSAFLLDISQRLTKLTVGADDVAARMSRIEKELTGTQALLQDFESPDLERLQREIQSQQCDLISKLPARIERSGLYCLQNNLEYSLLRHEDAITVAADDVTIDLRRGTLRGHGTGDTISAGVYSAGYRNLAVFNGTISGFMWGVRYDQAPPERKGGGTIVLRDLIVRDSNFRGIYVDFGADGVVEGSVAVTSSIIDRVGGSTVISNSYDGN